MKFQTKNNLIFALKYWHVLDLEFWVAVIFLDIEYFVEWPKYINLYICKKAAIINQFTFYPE